MSRLSRLVIVTVFSVIFLFSFAISSLHAVSVDPAASNVDWIMYRNDLGHSGYSTSDAPLTNHTIWNYTTGLPVYSSSAVSGGVVYVDLWHNVYALNASTGAQIWSYTTGGYVFSSPAVVGGVVYIGSDDGSVYALDAATGTKLWSYATGGEVFSSPAVASGVVYVGSLNGNVYALDAGTGAKVWNKIASGVFSSPAVVGGVVYIGSDDSNVYALNALTGAKIWNHTTGSYVNSSPDVAGGVVYVASWDGKFYALNASTGTQIWNYTRGGPVYSSPAVVSGVVYVGSEDDNVYALNASTGTQIWNYVTGGEVFSSPAVVGGVVYIDSDDGNVYALSALTGAKIWNYTTHGNVDSSPAVAGGVVYVGSDDGNVYALNAATGAKIWRYVTGGHIVLSSPAVVSGVVYVGSEDGNVYALNASTGTQIWSYTTDGYVKSSPAVAGSVVYVCSWDNNVYALNASTGTQIWSYTTGDHITSSPAVANGGVYVGGLDGNVYAFGQPWASVSPSSVVMDVGQSQLFTSTVSGGSLPYSYQWCLNGFAVAGATSSTWTFAPSYVGSYNVYVNVTDNSGFTEESNIATVTVNTALSASVSPSSVVMDVGQSQLFTSTVSSGTSPYSYQWYLNGASVSDATGPTYSLTPSATGSVSVYVQVTDNATTPVTASSNTAAVSVNSALVAPTSSASVGTVDQGQSSTLSVTGLSGGTSPYSYQWLQKAPGASSYSTISGANSNTYTFSTSDSTTTGTWSFELQVTDNATSPAIVTSSASSVVVNAALVAPTASAPSAVDQGQTISLTSASVSTGTGPYLYQWFSKTPSGDYTAISGATSSGFNSITSGATAVGSWSFILQVTDATGAAVNSTDVPVMVNPTLLTPVVSATSSEIAEGQTSTLSSTAVTTGTGPYSYQWFEKLSGGVYVTVGVNSPSFNFVTSGATATGSWSFILQVTDATGAAVNSTDVSVQVVMATSSPSPTPTPVTTPIHTPTPTPSPSPSPTVSPTHVPTASPSSSPTQSQSSAYGTYAVVGVVVALILVGVAAAVIVLRKRHKPQTFE